LNSTARIKVSGWRGLRWDDFLIAAAFLGYIVIAVLLWTIIDRGGQNINMPPPIFVSLSPEKQDYVNYTSKLIFIMEHVMLFVVFGVKYSMLGLYLVLTYVLSFLTTFA
jgi:hypothetical protein